MILLIVPASFLAAFLLSAGLNRLALIPWRRSVGAHWTERARRLHPARISAFMNPWLIATSVGISLHRLRSESVLAWLLPVLAAWLGAGVGNYFVDRQVWPGISFKTWAGQFTLYAMFFQIPILMVAIAIAAMPSHFGWQTWAITGTTLTIQLALLLGLSLKILRWTNLVQPAPANFRDLALREAERAGAKLRQVWIDRSPAAHAFALLPMKDMLFSERTLRLLSEDELAGVCAHEAAHLTESAWVFGGRLTAIAGLCPLMLIVPVVNQFGLLGVLLLLLAAIGLMYLPTRLARRMEKRADAAAVQQTPDPAVYARALEKIYETDLLPAAMPKRAAQVHPDLYDRMITAGVTPSYQRPIRPRKFSWTTLLLSLSVAVQIVMITPGPEFNNIMGPDAPLPLSSSQLLFGPANSSDGASNNTSRP